MSTWEDGDIARVAARMTTAAGTDIVNVYHLLFQGAGNDSDIVNPYILSWIDSIYDEIEPALDDGLTFTDIDITNVNKELGFPAYPWPTQVHGGATGEPLPYQLAAVIVGRTGALNRVARKFISGFIESANESGNLTSAIVATLLNAAVAWLAGVDVGIYGEMVPVIVKYVGKVATEPVLIETAAVSNHCFTQRRRRIGAGS